MKTNIGVNQSIEKNARTKNSKLGYANKIKSNRGGKTSYGTQNKNKVLAKGKFGSGIKSQINQKNKPGVKNNTSTGGFRNVKANASRGYQSKIKKAKIEKKIEKKLTNSKNSKIAMKPKTNFTNMHFSHTENSNPKHNTSSRANKEIKPKNKTVTSRTTLKKNGSNPKTRMAIKSNRGIRGKAKTNTKQSTRISKAKGKKTKGNRNPNNEMDDVLNKEMEDMNKEFEEDDQFNDLLKQHDSLLSSALKQLSFKPESSNNKYGKVKKTRKKKRKINTKKKTGPYSNNNMFKKFRPMAKI